MTTPETPAPPSTADAALQVMSFNALFQTDSTTEDDPGHWPRRAPAIEAMLAAQRPHLLGLQEMQGWTYGPIEAGLGPTYRSVGVGNRGGGEGLINPIFFDTQRHELLNLNQFVSTDPVRSVPRLGQRRARAAVRLDPRSGDRAGAGASQHHLDHVITQAKVKGAQLIADHLKQFHLLACPITTGDFNSVAQDSPAYTCGRGVRLQDSWTAAEQRLSPA